MNLKRLAPALCALALTVGSAALADDVVRFRYDVIKAPAIAAPTTVFTSPAIVGSTTQVITQPAVINAKALNPYDMLWEQAVLDYSGRYDLHMGVKPLAATTVLTQPAVIENGCNQVLMQPAVLDNSCGATITQPAVLPNTCGAVIMQQAVIDNACTNAAPEIITQPVLIESPNRFDLKLIK